MKTMELNDAILENVAAGTHMENMQDVIITDYMRRNSSGLSITLESHSDSYYVDFYSRYGVEIAMYDDNRPNTYKINGNTVSQKEAHAYVLAQYKR